MLGLSLSLKEICEKDEDGGDEWMASFVFLLFVANGASIHMCEYGEDSRAYNVFNICLLLLLFLRLLSLVVFCCLVLVLCTFGTTKTTKINDLHLLRRCHFRVWVGVWMCVCVTI